MQVSSTQTKSTPPPVVKKTAPSKKRRFMVLFILLIIAGLSGLSYHLWENLQQQMLAKEKLTQQINGQFQSYDNQLSTLTQQLSVLQAKIAAQDHALKITQTSIDEIKQPQQQDNRLLIVGEVNYLVQLAFYNLQFAQQIKLATQLLQIAEQRLNELTDASLLHIRQLLRNTIVALETLPAHRLENVLLQLTALQQQVNVLPVVIVLNKTPTAITVVQDNRTFWQRGLDNLKAQLKDIVIVRQTSQTSQRLITIDQQTILQQNVHTVLGQAQWAALYGNKVLYQQSLRQAQQMVQENFDPSQTVTQSFLTALEQLVNQPLHEDVPDLAPLLKSLATLSDTPTNAS